MATDKPEQNVKTASLPANVEAATVSLQSITVPGAPAESVKLAARRLPVGVPILDNLRTILQIVADAPAVNFVAAKGSFSVLNVPKVTFAAESRSVEQPPPPEITNRYGLMIVTAANICAAKSPQTKI